MKNRLIRNSRGIALTAVLVVLAAVTVLSLAILSNCALNAQIDRNQEQMARVDYLAESGVNLALYYLQFPGKAPTGSLNSAGYWPGATGIKIDTGVTGTVNVTVTANSATNFNIVSQSFSGDSTPLSRTINAVAQVNYNSTITSASGMDSALTVSSKVVLTGEVRSNSTVTIQVGGSIPGSGLVYAKSVTDLNPVPISPSRVVVQNPAITIPSTSINYYPTYLWTDGKLYTAQTLGATVTGTLTPNYSTNPAGIFVRTGNLAFSGAVVVNGTIILNSGKITDSSASATITPQAGYPALVVNGAITLALSNQTLTCNGVVWSNSGIAKQGNPTNCKLVVNGALLLSGSTAGTTLNQAWLTVNSTYQAANVKVPTLSTTATSVTLLSWQ